MCLSTSSFNSCKKFGTVVNGGFLEELKQTLSFLQVCICNELAIQCPGVFKPAEPLLILCPQVCNNALS